MTTVRLTIDGEEFEAEVEERGSTTSVHTGREVERLLVSFIAEGEGSLLEVSEAPDCLIEAKRFQGRVRQSSFREGSAYSSHVVELTEAESFSASRLTIDGLVVDPTEYREEGDDGVLVVTARCVVAPETLDAFFERRSQGSFFPVVRHDIQDAPRTMRFGAIFWSNTVPMKAEFTLVETGWDEINKLSQGLINTRDDNTDRAVASTSTLIDGLLKLLVDAGTISLNAAESLREQASSARATRRSLFEVRDIDDFPFEY